VDQDGDLHRDGDPAHRRRDPDALPLRRQYRRRTELFQSHRGSIARHGLVATPSHAPLRPDLRLGLALDRVQPHRLLRRAHDDPDRGDAPLHGETLKLRLRRIVIHVFAWALAIAWLFPFVGLLMASFRPIPEIIGGWWNFGQFSPTLDKFGSAFSKIGTGLGNSVLIAVPGTLIPMFVATLAGYGFAR